MPGQPDRDILEAIDAVYAAAGSLEAWPAALSVVADCFDAVGGVLVVQRPDGSLATLVSPRLEKAQRVYEDGAWEYDILASRFAECSAKTNRIVLTEQDLATPEEIRTHPIFTRFRYPQGIGSAMGAMLQPLAELPVIVSLHKARDKPSFQARDTARFEHLVRHIENALRLSLRLVEVETERNAFADALSSFACGAALLDGAGRMVFQNAVAAGLMGGQTGLIASRLGLDAPANSAESEVVQTRAPARFRDLSEPLKPSIVAGADGGEVALYFLPAKPVDFAAELASDVRFIVLMIPISDRQPVDPSLLRDLFGLTPAEARLAAMVASGRSPGGAAEDLGIAVDTARTVLKRVFTKTGVTRQAELAALVSRIPRDRG